MTSHSFLKIAVTAVTAGIFAAGAAAQTAENQGGKVNFRYSQNPKTRIKTETPPVVQQSAVAAGAPVVAVAKAENSIAEKTLEIARKSASKAASPTEVYKVGVGDVLFVNLQNAPKSSTYYTVLNDGTLDYPLAGEMVAVAGLTTDEIEDVLRAKIKLFENPQLSVKIRDYASHSIRVLGLVERAGERNIQREAVPLFVVRAEVVVSPQAAQAVIRRADNSVENLDLKDAKTDNVLIFPGDIVEFTAGSRAAEIAQNSQFYYIGGEITAGGQKDYYQNLSLTQAIMASGGVRRASVRKITIRRKNAEGLLIASEFNLKSIKEGKQPDPVILAGDTIEIGN